MNPIKEIKEEFHSAWKEPSSKEMTMLAVLFLVLFGVLGSYYLFWKGSWSGYVLIGAGIFLCLCRLVPPLFRRVFRLWIGLAITLGYIVSRVLLTLLFYVAVLPTGLLMRLFGKDPMERKRDPAVPSYWSKREYDVNTPLERYERQF
jgi:hypothetical protein